MAYKAHDVDTLTWLVSDIGAEAMGAWTLERSSGGLLGHNL